MSEDDVNDVEETVVDVPLKYRVHAENLGGLEPKSDAWMDPSPIDRALFTNHALCNTPNGPTVPLKRTLYVYKRVDVFGANTRVRQQILLHKRTSDCR